MSSGRETNSGKELFGGEGNRVISMSSFFKGYGQRDSKSYPSNPSSGIPEGYWKGTGREGVISMSSFF